MAECGSTRRPALAKAVAALVGVVVAVGCVVELLRLSAAPPRPGALCFAALAGERARTERSMCPAMRSTYTTQPARSHADFCCLTSCPVSLPCPRCAPCMGDGRLAARGGEGAVGHSEGAARVTPFDARHPDARCPCSVRASSGAEGAHFGAGCRAGGARAVAGRAAILQQREARAQCTFKDPESPGDFSALTAWN